ncbi:unnamed protein product [Sphagnum tenellum]
MANGECALTESMGAVAGMFNVFLNHRGPDVKMNFVAHLHEALLQARLHPFTDMESLVQGQPGQPSIYEALRGASVHVAVFSRGYADSTYCLDELCAMLESKKLLIPVFYDVSPGDLKCTNELQNGAYANAFRETHKNQPQAQVEKWKKALSDAAELNGFRLANYNGHEARLKQDIVIAVQKALPSSAQLQPVAKYAVGLDQSSRSVIETLNQMGDNVGVLSVVGMGGIGKTTLAWEVFNHFAKNDTSKFEKQSFLKNVRESPVLDLQKQLVRDLLQKDVESREDFNKWFNLFMGRKVLIVIDDIDKKPQFEQLIPEINKLARGSRVLITSRDRNLVANIMEKAECKYASHEVAALNNPDARELFNSHAFHSSNVADGFHDVAQRVADACAGLPLALEVIGSFLFGKINEHDLDCWEQTIKILHEEKNILDRLQISYDGLSTRASQLMFLDIACFFIGKHETMAMQIFESCSHDYKGPAASFSSLIDKSLVKLDGDGRIVMHDLLRDMGREVVKKQSVMDNAPLSHLWDPEMAERVLANREGTNRVRGLSVAGKGGAACVAENYTSMNALHFLLLDGCDVKGDFSTWSLELSWLQWSSSPLSALPLKLDLLKLAVLDLTDSKSLTRIWPSDSELEELQTLILENCCALEELPQNFGKLSRLKDLNMRGCSTLEALPDSMGQLRELEHLNLSSCGKLGSLPDSIVHLSKLKTIQLNECTQLKSLPRAFGELQSLVEFQAEGSSLSHLPHTFSSLSNLEHLHLYKCLHIQDLPPSMSGLGKLKCLRLCNCTRLTQLQGLESLPSLVEINVAGCTMLENFPCKELQTLILENCSALEELPQTFGKLSMLKDLNMRGCSTLEALPDSMGQLRELKHLNLSGCGKLGSLPDSIVHLSKLKTIQLNECTQLKSLPMAFGELQSLVEFRAKGSSLSHLPHTFSSLSNLEHLHLYKCSHIQDLPPSMSGLGKLKVLHMGQTRVQTLPEDFGKLRSLTELNLQECESLKSLPDNFGLLSELRKLVMHHNKSFVKLPEGFGRLQALVELDLGTCSIEEKGLSSDFGNLSALRTLRLQYNKLATLPETFRDLGALVVLEMHHCPNLIDVQALPWNLEHMDIGDCPKLTDIPFLGKMSLLKCLRLCNCTRLTQLQGLESLPSLVEINVAGCPMLENVSGVNYNRALEQCYFHEIRRLVEGK